jgi:hypothetical protein
MVPDGRHRVRALQEHLAVCRQLHRAASLVEYYRRPRAGFYCRITEGWRAA